MNITFEDFERHCSILFIKPEDVKGKFLHAAVGIAGEAGELLDAVKKHWIYGKDLDRVNVLEECGDLLFYLAMAGKQLGIPFHQFSGRIGNTGGFGADYLVAIISSIFSKSAEVLDVANDWYFGQSEVVGKPEFRRDASAIFYEVETLLRSIGYNLQDAFAHNIAKLSARYPEGYTDHAAITRADKGAS